MLCNVRGHVWLVLATLAALVAAREQTAHHGETVRVYADSSENTVNLFPGGRIDLRPDPALPGYLKERDIMSIGRLASDPQQAQLAQFQQQQQQQQEEKSKGLILNINLHHAPGGKPEIHELGPCSFYKEVYDGCLREEGWAACAHDRQVLCNCDPWHRMCFEQRPKFDQHGEWELLSRREREQEDDDDDDDEDDEEEEEAHEKLHPPHREEHHEEHHDVIQHSEYDIPHSVTKGYEKDRPLSPAEQKKNVKKEMENQTQPGCRLCLSCAALIGQVGGNQPVNILMWEQIFPPIWAATCPIQGRANPPLCMQIGTALSQDFASWFKMRVPTFSCPPATPCFTPVNPGFTKQWMMQRTIPLCDPYCLDIQQKLSSAGI